MGMITFIRLWSMYLIIHTLAKTVSIFLAFWLPHLAMYVYRWYIKIFINPFILETLFVIRCVLMRVSSLCVTRKWSTGLCFFLATSTFSLSANQTPLKVGSYQITRILDVFLNVVITFVFRLLLALQCDVFVRNSFIQWFFIFNAEFLLIACFNVVMFYGERVKSV